MTKELKADLSLLLVTVVWGASFPVISLLLKYIHPYSFIAIRYFLSGAILAIIFHKRFKHINKKTINSAVIIGIALFLGSVFQVVGLVYTTPSKSGFITGLYVVVVPIIMAVMYKVIPDAKTTMGIIFALIGLGVISIDSTLKINPGDFLTLLCAIAFAFQIILVDKYIKDVDIILVTCIETLVAGILGFVPAVIVENLSFTINLTFMLCMIFMVVFCTIGAYMIQNKMQPYTNPTHAAIIFLGEPVFGAIFSMIFGDKLTGKTLAGCALILLGMIIINIKNNSSNEILEN